MWRPSGERAGTDLGKSIVLASKLEHLSLDVQENSEGTKTSYGKALDNWSLVMEVLNGHFPALKCLKVEGATIACVDLLEFVKRHKAFSLNNLILINCSLERSVTLGLQDHLSEGIEAALIRHTGLQSVQIIEGNRVLLPHL